MRTLRIALMGLSALAIVACAHSKKRSPGPYGEPPGAIPGAPTIPHRDLAQAAPDQQGTAQANPGSPGTTTPGTGTPGASAPDSQIVTPTPAPIGAGTPSGAGPVDDQRVMSGTSAGQPSTSGSPSALPTATP